jgi:hypothetical protein
MKGLYKVAGVVVLMMAVVLSGCKPKEEAAPAGGAKAPAAAKAAPAGEPKAAEKAQ